LVIFDDSKNESGYHSRMMQRVFVKVVGFTGVERHSLNTIFRLSQDKQSAREWSYEPWTQASPTSPRLAIIDGASPDANEALAEIEASGGIGVIWVGAISPAKAWSAFQRPLTWSQLLFSMDEYFTPRGGLDVDWGSDTWPSVLESTGAYVLDEADYSSHINNILIADADKESRLYWRTKLASFGINQIVEVSNVLEARDYLAPMTSQRTDFDAVVVDLDLPGGDAWSVMAAAGSARLKLITQARLSFSSRINAKARGYVSMGKPLDPTRLNQLLQK
jgi:CheY-like chemotaxis protein